MSIVTLPARAGAAGSTPGKTGLSSWQLWGMILVTPYLLVFALFVVYPVIYAFWLAHDPESYVELWTDPIFQRSVVNTLVFLFIGINLKMMVALLLL